MKLIVGLGNPGRSYSLNRHNIGFMILDLLAGRHGIETKKKSFGALIGNGRLNGEAVLLAKPQTFMNLSGESASPLLGYYKLGVEDLIVVHDDIDIDLGKIKLARGAGHGGHNGVRSIIDCTGSSEFCRVRVGVGRPPEGFDAASYVLEDFTGAEETAAKRAVERAADAVEKIIEEGFAAAQQSVHTENE